MSLRLGLGGLACLLVLSACADPALQGQAGHDGRPAIESAGTPLSVVTPVRNLTGTLAGTPFGDAVAAAVLNDPRTTRTRSSISSAEAGLLAADGAFLPGFDAGVDFRQSVGTARDTEGDVIPFVRVSQLIYDGGASASRRTAAEAQLAGAKDSTLRAMSDAALDAVTAWADVHAAREIKQLLDRNLEAHRDFLAQIEERQRMGAGGQGDVLKLRARTADARTEALNAEADLDRAEARFEEVFGRAPGAVGALPAAPRLSSGVSAANAQASEALEFSPRLRAAQAQLDVAQARLLEVRASRMPQVEMSVRGQPDASFDGEVEVLFDLSVDYTFDTRRARAAAIARAEADVATAEADLAQARREVRRALDFLESERATGTRRQESALQAQEANRRTVLAARDEFSIGRRQLPEVLDAQRDFVRAERAVVEADREVALLGYEALALTGDIVTAFDIGPVR